MSLTYTRSWIKAAKAGARKPVLLFDFRPVVAYDEANHRGDWKDAVVSDSANLGHGSDELRLAENSTAVFNSEKQLNQSGHLTDTFWSFISHPLMQHGLGGGQSLALSDFIQICKFDWSFRIKKLYIGLYNRNNDYKGFTNIRLLAGVQKRNPANAVLFGETQDAIGQAEEILNFRIDHSLDGQRADETEYEKVSYISDSESKRWCVINLDDQNVWMPGKIPCAITIGVESISNPQDTDKSTDAANLILLGSDSRDSYSNGDCLKSARAWNMFTAIDGDMSFKFEIAGYESSGYAKLAFDLGTETFKEDRFGELELRYADPTDTSLVFRKRESADNEGWGDWGIVSDGAKIKQRYVQVWVAMSSPKQYNTPRIYSIRCTIKDSQKFIMAQEPVFGYPSVAASPPDYSAEGDPLAGTAKSVDRSKIELVDSGGMISNFLNQYHFKNCEVIVKLGFNNSGFTEDDYLAFKTLWVEDWEIMDGKVAFHCYDQQVKFREAEAPTAIDPPEMTEEIHYSAMTPAAIKRDLLKRAQIRPSRINGGSFAALESAFAWDLTHAIRKPAGLRKIDEALNKHLLAFMSIDERGRWSVRYVNFDASAVAAFSGNDLNLRSEKFLPGRKALRNVVTVLFGGTGIDDTAYRGIAVDFDEDSRKQNVESAYDKLYSEFIPLTEDARDPSGVPMTVARRRLNLQKEGLRVIEWASPIEFAYLQIGDHVEVTSTLYQRSGATSPNPLMVIITRKSIARSLGQISWTGIILYDGDESIDGSSPTIEAPTNFAVSVGGDGTVGWSWDASADDTGATNQHYRLYQRPAHLDDWGAYKASVTATGASSYTSSSDSEFSELVRYDFGVRFVDSNGRLSAIVAVESTLLTDSSLDALSDSDWGMAGLEGAVEIYIINEATDAVYYNVYARPDKGRWHLAGTIQANVDRKYSYIWTPPNPYSWTSERWVQFKVAAVDHWGAEGTQSSAKTFSYFPLLASADTLSAPTLADDESYPEITRTAVGPYQAFSIKHKITAYSGEQDMAGYYELRRRDDGGSTNADPFVEVVWGAWQILPANTVKQVISSQPAPNVLYYDNTDRKIKPGYYYQYQARAVGRNGKPGAWSDTVELELTDDTTAPAQPTISVVALPLGNLLTIVGGTEADFAYFKIEGSSNAGSDWEDLVKKQVLTLWMHDITVAGIETSWRYRVTAYDHSGNASTVSAVTTDYTATLIVADIVAARTFLGVELALTANLTCGTSNNVVRISGDDANYRFWAGHATAASAPFSVTKAGALLATNVEIRTSDSGDDRIEIGNAEESIKLYSGGTLRGKWIKDNFGVGFHGPLLWMESISGAASLESRLGGHHLTITNDDINRIKLHTDEGLGGYLQLWTNGGDRFVYADAFSTALILENSCYLDANGYIKTDDVFKVGANQVVGARGVAVASVGALTGVQAIAGGDTINLAALNILFGTLFTELGTWYTAINATLARIRAHGLIST